MDDLVEPEERDPCDDREVDRDEREVERDLFRSFLLRSLENLFVPPGDRERFSDDLGFPDLFSGFKINLNVFKFKTMDL